MSRAMQEAALAYSVMASHNYRPAAPSDGFGNIVAPLDLETEVRTYAKAYAEQGEARAELVGVPDGRTGVALVLTIEAARLMCAPHPRLAAQLLREALTRLEEATA